MGEELVKYIAVSLLAELNPWPIYSLGIALGALFAAALIFAIVDFIRLGKKRN